MNNITVAGVGSMAKLDDGDLVACNGVLHLVGFSLQMLFTHSKNTRTRNTNWTAELTKQFVSLPYFKTICELVLRICAHPMYMTATHYTKC